MLSSRRDTSALQKKLCFSVEAALALALEEPFKEPAEGIHKLKRFHLNAFPDTNAYTFTYKTLSVQTSSKSYSTLPVGCILSQ